ncbi:uncharacterized protein CIMG_13582 [Coccidioides immitis RS]|uniref:Uncharacterized protein n=1 Tax=Coccidioides immitis (strain RS) TaxID=246410 RepID=A0A0D8JWL8_COCIM|nr:uncharacterized protein CIMG_13582 [Coccidioides immitis RS]KJF61331.1 hypothetical protein CIMG_13582 [Coccidioides immitis RS]
MPFCCARRRWIWITRRSGESLVISYPRESEGVVHPTKRLWELYSVFTLDRKKTMVCWIFRTISFRIPLPPRKGRVNGMDMLSSSGTTSITPHNHGNLWNRMHNTKPALRTISDSTTSLRWTRGSGQRSKWNAAQFVLRIRDHLPPDNDRWDGEIREVLRTDEFPDTQCLIARFDDSVNEESCGLNYPTLQAAMLEKLPRLRTFDLNLAGLHNISPSSFDSFMPDPEHFSTRALLSGKNTEFPVIAYILSCGISSSGWTTRPASSSLCKELWSFTDSVLMIKENACFGYWDIIITSAVTAIHPSECFCFQSIVWKRPSVLRRWDDNCRCSTR